MKVTAQATRSGGWWAVEVPEVPGAFTQVKRLEQVAEAAAEAVADLLDVPAAAVDVEVTPVLAPDLREAVEAARRAARVASQAQEQASTKMRAAAAALREDFTARDAAVVLGVSHQRIAQLQAGPAKSSSGGRERGIRLEDGMISNVNTVVVGGGPVGDGEARVSGNAARGASTKP